MTPAETQARYRARKARERDREARELDHATRELLHGARLNLGTLARYLVAQGDPAELATVLAELDGPPLPAAMLAHASGWLARFTEVYRYATLLRVASVAETDGPASD
jgi:hypothetical protein